MQQRRLAAIMFTDIVGYTALMGRDVDKALELLRKNREIQKPLIEKHDGKWLKEMGDGVLAQFNSAIDSVLCALEIQKLARAELDGKLRIGIHLGDVTIEDEDAFGDGVNIASRLQAIADPGGIYVSESIHEAIRGHADIRSNYLGEIQLKNVDHLIKTYYLEDEGLPTPSERKELKLLGAKHKTNWNKVYIYIAAILIAVIAITGWQITNKTGKGIEAIAVLPVENMSGNSDEEWLEAGIHHALIDEIGKIHALRVVSRTSSMKYQNSDMTVPEIARELDVDGIVEASFFKKGDSVNIQIRLIQARPEERQIWRHAYDRGIKNVLSIYNDIANAVAHEANITLTSKEEDYLSYAKEVNPDAYEAYLRGMSHWEKLTETDLEKAMGYFEMARDIDPNYALAYAGIAQVWVGQIAQGFRPFSEAEPKSKEAARKALKLDSTLVEIHWMLAFINLVYDWDWERLDIEFQRIINLNPNYAIAQAYYSHYLTFMGHPEEGLIHSELATKLDPFNTLFQALHGLILKNARKYDEALIQLQKTLITEPNQRIALPALWAVYHEKFMYPEALQIAKRTYAAKGDSVAIKVLDRGNQEGGYKLAMQRAAEMMVSRKDTSYVTPWQIGTLYTRAGMNDEALEWLEKAYEEHDSNMSAINIDPLFDGLREDDRFKNLLRQMNFPK